MSLTLYTIDGIGTLRCAEGGEMPGQTKEVQCQGLTPLPLEVVGEDGSYVLRESPASYKSILGHENDVLRPENAYFWDHNQ
jgi:hypothetical protein